MISIDVSLNDADYCINVSVCVRVPAQVTDLWLLTSVFVILDVW